jgi:hypothetical protein
LLLTIPGQQEEELHMKIIGIAAFTFAAVVSAGAAQAQTTIITEPGPPVVTFQPPIVLTPTQRQVIYQNIVREPVVQEQVTIGAPAPVVEYRVGARVPANVTLRPIPQRVVTEVPTVSPYRYMVINNRTWLVDPATSTIIAEVSE